MTGKLTSILICFCIGLSSLIAQNPDVINIGTTHFIQSEILGEQREFWVKLPESYNTEGKEYKKYPW